MAKHKTIREIFMLLLTPVDTSYEDRNFITEEGNLAGLAKVLFSLACAILITLTLGQLN